jgi:excisionase family DNA binding protein
LTRPPHAPLTPEVDRLLSIPQAAKALGFSTLTIRRRIKDGTLRATRIFGRLRVYAVDIKRLQREGRVSP